MRYRLFFFLGLVLILWGCDESRVFEKNIDLKGNDWYIDSTANYTFKIEDPAIKYNLYAQVRNSISYPFANLYIKYNLKDSVGKELQTRLLRLPLFDKKTGQPYGNGLGDIFDHRFSLEKDYTFPKEGTYQVEIIQYMRQDPLPFIMAVGLRVEKAE